MTLYYDGNEGDAFLDAWTAAYQDQSGTWVARIQPRVSQPDVPLRQSADWTVWYHPGGNTAREAVLGPFGPFATFSEATARLEAAYALFVAAGDPESGLDCLESSEYPWPGLA